MTTPERMRVDKWLWHARFFKSRSIAAQAVTSGRIRVNGHKISRASAAVRPGDAVTIIIGRHIRLVSIEALGERRGPAPEAQLLYNTLDES
ncbi:MAG: RNA-binding S4 domain-containing protein [Pseudomonadota bacterium]